jgi:hypothetical protein
MATPTVFTPKRLMTPALLPVFGSIAANYTVPALTVTQIKEVIFANTVATANTVRLYLVPSGGSLGDLNCVMKDFSLPTDGTPIIFEFDSLYMNAADTLQASAANASQVSMHVTGTELA